MITAIKIILAILCIAILAGVLICLYHLDQKIKADIQLSNENIKLQKAITKKVESDNEKQ